MAEPHDLVVIGASAGGVETLTHIIGDLPDELPATVCIVVHIAPTSPSALAHILARATSLPCRAARDGEPLILGDILVAPPDRHLEIEDGVAKLTVGPSENGHRPAVDTLFRTAAAARERRVIGVVLTGNQDDGTAGLELIRASGGATIVQDPDDAQYSGMPANALANVSVDAVVPAELIADTIAAMVRGEPLPGGVGDSAPADDPEEEGGVSAVCPACGGVLTEQVEAGVTQWQCRVGHRYSPTSLADARAEDAEAALWTAVRALEDRAALLQRMAEKAEMREQSRSARSFQRRAETASEQAERVRQVLIQAVAGTLTKVVDTGDEPGEREIVG